MPFIHSDYKSESKSATPETSALCLQFSGHVPWGINQPTSATNPADRGISGCENKGKQRWNCKLDLRSGWGNGQVAPGKGALKGTRELTQFYQLPHRGFQLVPRNKVHLRHPGDRKTVKDGLGRMEKKKGLNTTVGGIQWPLNAARKRQHIFERQW